MEWRQASLWFAYVLFLMGLLSLGSTSFDSQQSADAQMSDIWIQSTP